MIRIVPGDLMWEVSDWLQGAGQMIPLVYRAMDGREIARTHNPCDEVPVSGSVKAWVVAMRYLPTVAERLARELPRGLTVREVAELYYAA